MEIVLIILGSIFLQIGIEKAIGDDCKCEEVKINKENV